MEYAYEDETFSNNFRFRQSSCLYYWPAISVTPDKYGYDLMETANIIATINGQGAYSILLNCPEAGISQTRTVEINPESGSNATEIFQVPIGLNTYYHVVAQVTDASGNTFTRTPHIFVRPIKFDYSGEFKDIIARTGQSLEFEINLEKISGFSQPITGELSVTSTQLNYQDIKTVTLQPTGDNLFSYTIPIGMEVTVGKYELDVQLTINGIEFISQQHFIHLPAAKLSISKPGISYQAGDSNTPKFVVSSLVH